MTNEEITVKYSTSIKNTDAADRTGSGGMRCLPSGAAAAREGVGLTVRADIFRMRRKISSHPCFTGDTAGRDGKGVRGRAWALPGDEKVGPDPAAAWWAPCSWSYASLWPPMASCGSL